MVIIDINDRITVNNAGKYDAEVITGAKIKMENGLTIPPVKKSKKPNCRVSKSRKENAFTLLIDLFFLSSKQEYKLTATDSRIIVKISNSRISILIMQNTLKTAKN